MNEEFNKLILESIPDQESANELMAKLFTVTQPSAVYSQPVQSGDYTVITASEITAGLGFGYGGGGGFGPVPEEDDETETTPPPSGGYGGGGGGGGGASARPVAAVIIGPNGVRVEPIVDPTKIALAFFTAFGAMFMALNKMRKFRQTGKLD